MPIISKAHAASAFTDVTSTYQVSSSAVNRRTASWVDIDNDGDLDLYSLHQGNNHLYQNNGSGVAFTEVTTTYGLADGTADHSSASWADFDKDGDMDLYLSNNITANKLYRNNGVGVAFTDVTSIYSLAYGTNLHLGSNWVDFDNDSDLDLFITSQIGYNKLFQNNGVGVAFTDVTASYGIQTNYYQHYSASWIDFDNDGDLDVYYANLGGGYGTPANELYRNNGVGVPFTDVTSTYGLIVSIYNKYSASWADFDNDGDLDLFVPSSTPKLMRNNGVGVPFTDVSSTYGVSNTATGQGNSSWIDIDNDADLDLYVTQSSGSNRLYLNNGVGVAFSEVAASYGLTDGKRSVNWIDFDNDGDLDQYAVNTSAENKLLSNPGQGNNYLHLVINNSNNIYQYNSRVQVDVDGNGDFSTSGTLVTQYQSNSNYSGGTQYNASQDPVGLFFGLGSDTSCKYDFRVYLPGTAPSATPNYVYTDVCPNQKLTISSTQYSPSPSASTATPTPTPTPASTVTSSSACDNSPVSEAPNLFQVDKQADMATLYFTPVSAYSRYFLSYSSHSNAEEHSVEFDQTYTGGVSTYTVNSLNPDSTYYFKIRGVNTCNTGSWSAIISTVSPANTSSTPSVETDQSIRESPPIESPAISPTKSPVGTDTRWSNLSNSISDSPTVVSLKSKFLSVTTKIRSFFNSLFSFFSSYL